MPSGVGVCEGPGPFPAATPCQRAVCASCAHRCRRLRPHPLPRAPRRSAAAPQQLALSGLAQGPGAAAAAAALDEPLAAELWSLLLWAVDRYAAAGQELEEEGPATAPLHSPCSCRRVVCDWRPCASLTAAPASPPAPLRAPQASVRAAAGAPRRV
jgi:hypothetical protein